MYNRTKKYFLNSRSNSS